MAASCSFQISYISLELPINNAKLSQPYELKLDTKEVQKYLYYHANPVSFKIVKLIGAGTLDVYIFPMKDQKATLKEVLSSDLQSYPIVDKNQR